MNRTRRLWLSAVIFGSMTCGGVIALSCSGSGGQDDNGAADANDDATSGDGLTGDGVSDSFPADGPTYSCPDCGPFPPIGTPECAPTTLAPATIAYPLDGSLLPPNMNVLEVQFTQPMGATLFEVDFTNATTLVKVVTKCGAVPDVRGGASRGCGVTLPQAAWNDIANKNRDGDPVHVTVRATSDGKCVASSTTKVNILFAKEDLAGGIYYWQSATYGGVAGTTGGIYSHDFGTFDPTPTPFYTSGGTGTCVGCHTLSRDGMRMALATDDPDADDEFGDVKTHVMDVAKRTVLGGAAMSPGFQTFTHDHAKLIASTWKTQKNQAFAVFDGDGAKLLLSNPLPTGMKATHPDLSRDDKSLVFVVPANLPGKTVTSISAEGDHHFIGGSLYTAPFDAVANTIGAPAAILTAVGTTNYYYPSFAPTGSFLVLNEAPKEGAFTNRNARVKLLHYPPMAGDKPLDLPALNVADGLSNSWPRWSPFVQTYKGKKILWATFSSNRDYGLHLVNKSFDNCYPPEGPTDPVYGAIPYPPGKKGVLYEGCAQPQIWMAGVIVDETRALDTSDRSFPAFWLPFQDVNSHNHSAQWVEKIVSTPPPDAGTCVPAGGDCSAATCCTDTVCCVDKCTYVCVK